MTQAAQRLADDGVVGVVGHLNSGTSIPASKIYSQAGVVQITAAATNPVLTQQGFRTTYRLVANDLQQGPAPAGFAISTLHPKRIVIVDDSTAYGQGLSTEFGKTIKRAGVDVVSHEATSDKSIDFVVS